MIAKYCTERGDNKSAMEFLVIAGRKPEAEAMARAKNALEEYASVLGDQGTPEEYNKLSNEFESALNYARAGDMAAKAKDYKRVRACRTSAGSLFHILKSRFAVFV